MLLIRGKMISSNGRLALAGLVECDSPPSHELAQRGLLKNKGDKVSQNSYDKITTAYVWLMLIGGFLWIGLALKILQAPEAGWFYDFELMRQIGSVGGLVFLVTAVAYYLTYRRHYFGR